MSAEDEATARVLGTIIESVYLTTGADEKKLSVAIVIQDRAEPHNVFLASSEHFDKDAALRALDDEVEVAGSVATEGTTFVPGQGEPS